MLKFILVLFILAITLSTAVLLNYGAKSNNSFNLLSFAIIMSVITINFLKFKIWGHIYKKYQLSESYPLVSLFFPLIYLVAIWNDEANIEMSKIIGITLILIGIGIMNVKNVR